MIANPKTMLQKALRGNYAVGAFNVNNMEVLQADAEAAENLQSPVILQVSEGAIEYAGMDYLLAMMQVAAKRTKLPVAIHLDHGKDVKVIREAIRSGFTSVMFDGSNLPYAENLAKTAQVVKWAHAKNVYVEAELGAIVGKEDFVEVAEREASFTDPEQARDFVKRSGCDALAVSIGTAHGPVKFIGDPKIDIARLKKIHAALPNTPLVLHGASSVPDELIGETELYCAMIGDCHRLAGAKGLPDAQLKQAIANGVCKVNTDTDLRIAFTASVRETLIEQKDIFDPRKLLGPARDKIRDVVLQRIGVFGSKGKA